MKVYRWKKNYRNLSISIHFYIINLKSYFILTKPHLSLVMNNEFSLIIIYLFLILFPNNKTEFKVYIQMGWLFNYNYKSNLITNLKSYNTFSQDIKNTRVRNKLTIMQKHTNHRNCNKLTIVRWIK